jgi:hypothetical protein
MLSLDVIAEEAQRLPIEQRKQLVMLILDSFTDVQPQSDKPYRLQAFRGLAAHLRDMDAQEHVNQLRDEWDEHP